MSIAWTILYGSTEKTLAEWGVARLQRSRSNQDQDTVSFDYPGDAQAALPFPYGATVIIKRAGAQWFYGRVIQTPRVTDPQSERIGYVLAGPWFWLEKIIYQQTWYLAVDPANPESSLAGGLTPEVLVNQGINGTRLNTDQQIRAALQFAIDAGAPIQLAADPYPAMAVFITEGRSLSCAEVIRRQFRFMPDGVTWFDYSTTPPTFHCARRADLAAVSLATADTGGSVRSHVLNQRDDLKVPSVLLKYKQVNTTNGAANLYQTVDKYPADATGLELNALVGVIDLQGWEATWQQVDVEVQPIIYGPFLTPSDLIYRKIAALQDPSVELIGFGLGYIDEDGTSYDWLNQPGAIGHLFAAYPNELVSGGIASWMGVNAKRITVTGVMAYYVGDGSGDPTRRTWHQMEPISFEMTVTNATSKTYERLQFAQDGDAVPVGLAQQMYIALNETVHDGYIEQVMEELDTVVSLGNKVNLTGGRAEWTTMAAPVQSVTEDVDQGVRRLELGIPKHLSAGELVDLLRVTRTRFVYTAPQSMDDGQMQARRIEHPKHTPRGGVGGGMGSHIVELALRDDNEITPGAPRGATVLSGPGRQLFLRQDVDLSLGLRNPAGGMTSGVAYAGSTLDLNLVGCEGKVIQVRRVEVKLADGTNRKLLVASSDPSVDAW